MKRKNKFGVLLLVIMLITACQKSKDISTDWAILPFTKVDSVNPILSAGTGLFTCPILKQQVKWEEKDVFNPAAIVRNDTVFLLYRAEDTIGKYAGTSRIGLAYSLDGLHFVRRPEPVLFPDEDFMKEYEWEGGIEDPRIILREDGTYFLTYTAYDGKLARLCIASSKDLLHWTKHGLVIGGKYKDTWSKSAAIVGKKAGEKIIAQKINGKYWMYFGDTDLFLASSDDLIQWQPVEENGKIKSVLQPRAGYFDSRLVESGPFALATKDGILLPYNGMNLQSGGDTAIEADAYCAGQALFDSTDPSKLINRLEKNFLMPEKNYELEGQVHRVCFIEGMVPFKEKWFLYYGTADSKIAVAIGNVKD
jgi:predicted GH43/DUF377 family glycosyl hydrolase